MVVRGEREGEGGQGKRKRERQRERERDRERQRDIGCRCVCIWRKGRVRDISCFLVYYLFFSGLRSDKLASQQPDPPSEPVNILRPDVGRDQPAGVCPSHTHTYTHTALGRLLWKTLPISAKVFRATHTHAHAFCHCL